MSDNKVFAYGILAVTIMVTVGIVGQTISDIYAPQQQEYPIYYRLPPPDSTMCIGPDNTQLPCHQIKEGMVIDVHQWSRDENTEK